MKRVVFRLVNFTYFLACWWVFFSIDAYAYIDPSAVTYVIQAVAAVFIALGAIFTVFRHKIYAFLKGDSKKSKKREIHLKENSLEEISSNK